MTKKASSKKTDPLQELVAKAKHQTLEKLIVQLSAEQPNTRRRCIEFLKKYVAPDDVEKTEVEIICSLWSELEPDLSELDEYGGGDSSVEEGVENLLFELAEKLKGKNIPKDARRPLLDEVFPYIKSGNAGMDDALYEVAYASCHDNDDWKDLAERFEKLGGEWPVGHARDIYRKLGNHEKYLSLRLKQMRYGCDYHDLATFYWQNGEKEKAFQIAKEGLEKGEGRMDELRAFLSARAKSTGDRKGYLDLQWEQAMDLLTLKSYKDFKSLCKEDEWRSYEPKILNCLDKAWDDERLKIHLFRNEHEQAAQFLLKRRYPHWAYEGEISLKVAAQLEQKYPEEILKFYQSGLENLNMNDSRSRYAAKAKVAAKVRHMWVEVLGMPEKWEAFAKEIKIKNFKRPAFQQEFRKIIPEWDSL